MRTKFNQADIDGNGALSPSELAHVCSLLGTTLKKNELETAVFVLDKNEDGKITFEEFQAWWIGADESIF